jgi:hypothetical protein
MFSNQTQIDTLLKEYQDLIADQQNQIIEMAKTIDDLTFKLELTEASLPANKENYL